jgi:Type II secretion system (T2SS), protein E, N-terminal domain
MTVSALEACRQRADHAGVRFVSLEPTLGAQDAHVPVDPAVRSLLPPELCRELALLPVAIEDGTVLIASAEPVQYLPYDVAAALRGRPVSFVLVPDEQLARALDSAKGAS